MRRHLEGDDYKDRETFRQCKTVWFQAWKYKEEDEILAALIEEILKSIKKDESFINRVKGEVENFTNKIDILKGVGEVAKHFIGLDVNDFLSKPEYKERLGFYDTFQEFFDRVLWAYLNLRPQLTSNEKPDDSKGALIVFIDDLDRCPRPKILKVLETIKLFMDKEGCVFIVGASEEIIERALKDTYPDEEARRFLDKIVQVTFNLPQIHNNEFNGFLSQIDQDARDKIEPHLPYILPTTRNNPRHFKRFLNDLYLMEGIHRKKATGIDYTTLLFWKIVEYEAPGLIKEVKENRATFKTLKDIINKISEKDAATGTWEISEERIKEVQAKSLHRYLENRKLTELIRNLDLSQDQVEQLISLSVIVKGVVETEAEPGGEVEYKPRYRLDEMVEVPAGKFQFGDDKKPVEIAESFYIDVYPVTNQQYEVFIKDKGYQNDNYWSKEGRKWRNEDTITLPRYWDNEKWNQPEHPVVGVSFYEAEAYAQWAKKELPTEQQWERAARGTDGREYPWEGEFDKEKCNTRESGIGKTSRVTLYPNGISPAGCYDMAGNVWEWTESPYDEDRDSFVLRGGSWSYFQEFARCVIRTGGDPDGRFGRVGFRCVRTKG